MRAFPPLVRGGRWTVRLKRFLPTAVNAIGIAAECERGRVVWLFNTDGTDSPITEASLGADAGVETVEVLRWHGFGEVVAPSFWTVGSASSRTGLCWVRHERAGGLPSCGKDGTGGGARRAGGLRRRGGGWCVALS